MEQVLTYWPEATEDPVISAIIDRAEPARAAAERDPDEIDPAPGTTGDRDDEDDDEDATPDDDE